MFRPQGSPGRRSLPFDWILDRITGSGPSETDYIVERPANCSNCRHISKDTNRAGVERLISLITSFAPAQVLKIFFYCERGPGGIMTLHKEVNSSGIDAYEWQQRPAVGFRPSMPDRAQKLHDFKSSRFSADG